MKRRDQNRALKELETLDSLVGDLKKRALSVIVRGTHSSGIFVPIGSEQGTPPPSYNDPTGETATSVELADSVESDVKALVTHVHNALNIAKHILSITPSSVAERAERSIPDCTACGDPVVGKIFYGRWDDKCRQRFRKWVAEGNPPDEKLRFEQFVQTSDHPQ